MKSSRVMPLQVLPVVMVTSSKQDFRYYYSKTVCLR